MATMATTAGYSARNGEGPMGARFRRLFLDDIGPDPHNPRKVFDEAALAELAASIAADGLLEPLLVRPNPARGSDAALHATGPRWLLVAGERRWRAARLAGLEMVDAQVREDLDERAALRLALVENLQRRDLDPLEEAEGYAQLNRVVGLTQAEIAQAVNRSQPAIANAMRLLDLPAEARALIRAGDLSVSHGIALARWKRHPEFAATIAATAARDGWTAKDLEKLSPDDWRARATGAVQQVYPDRTSSPFVRETCLACPFGALVEVKRGERWTEHYCLRPSHFKELVAAHRETELRAARDRVAAAGDDPARLPQVVDLPRQSYRICKGAVPVGCDATCPCRGSARLGDDTVPICTDPGRFDALQRAEQEAQAKEAARQKRARRKADEAAVSAAIDAITAREPASRRELVVLVSHLIDGRTALAKEAVKRLGIALDVDIVSSYAYHQSGKRYRALFRLADRDLVRLGVEILLREDLRQQYEYGGEAARVAWYLRAVAGDGLAGGAGDEGATS